MRLPQRRRRRHRLIPLLAVAALGFAGCAGPAAAPPGPSPSPSAFPSPGPSESTPAAEPPPAGQETCGGLVDRLSPEDRIGQLFMVGKTSTEPVDPTYGQMLAESRAGHVVLLGNSRDGTARIKELTDDLRRAAREPEGIRLFVAVDQEGGAVQRLQGPGFDTMPPARVQANRPLPELEQSAQHWAKQLSAAGVDVNLAPVADVVPPDRVADNAPIGQLERQYGESPEDVTPRVEAVVRGLDQAAIASSLKHFPGLGHVTGNTDFTGNVADDSVDADDPGLDVFRAGIDAGADMVMIATASYELLDPGVPAAFSPVVINELLRSDLGFTGVVISDDLGAAQQVADVPPGDRAVRFLAAGGDIVINGDPSLQAQMTEAVRARAAADPAFADEIRAKVARVVTMKANRGAVSCLPS